MSNRTFIYTWASLILCLTLLGATPFSAHAAGAPVAKKQPAAKAKIQPRQSAMHLTSIEPSAPRKPVTQTAKAPASQAAPQAQTPVDDKLKSSLDVFAKDCVARMNKQRRPGITHKEVKKQADGSYMARYVIVDLDSLETSYNATTNKNIKYIGHMRYHEVEYVSQGKSQQQALAGPFNEANRTPLTELIKYKKGKWTY